MKGVREVCDRYPPAVVEPSVKAQVLFSWKGSKDNHLTLEKGLVVSVLEQNDKWWSGEVEGRVGWFPKTFVRLLDPEPPPPPPPQQQQQQQPRCATLNSLNPKHAFP